MGFSLSRVGLYYTSALARSLQLAFRLLREALEPPLTLVLPGDRDTTLRDRLLLEFLWPCFAHPVPRDHKATTSLA